jgi:argininosuccinate lyase
MSSNKNHESEKKAWGGRFDEELDAVAARLNTSVDVDKRLAQDDIRGSIAHVQMLAAQGIVSHEDRAKIEAGLQQIREEIESGEMVWRADREDVHMNIEALLTERIGEAGGRLHIGRALHSSV